MNQKPTDYRSAGVDVEAGEKAVDAIRGIVRTTYNQNVLGDLGSFGGLFKFDRPDLREPILVASTDGVGTKLRVAIMAGVYNTVGQDLVNHCVNDILVQGALPLFYLDYIGLGKLRSNIVEQVISGMAKACRENGCALIGGEMAEMPGFYGNQDFDLAGTIVGVVDRPHLLPGDRINKGDLLVGISSSGLHTNGYSLVRKIVFDNMGLQVESYVPELEMTVAEALLAVHRSYLPLMMPHLKHPGLHGLAHITGGGIPGNLKRIIPDGLTAYVSYSLEEIPPLFKWLKTAGQLSRETMLESLNLGLGLVAVVDPAFGTEFIEATDSFVIGEINDSRALSDKVHFIG